MRRCASNGTRPNAKSPPNSSPMAGRSAAEREAARREAARRDFAALLDSWGGVTIAYRRRLIDAPSYTLNHEEVAKAMEEGIRFAEMLTPVAVEVDQFGQAAGPAADPASPAGSRRPPARANQGPGEEVVLPARTILVAAGTQPNTVLGREDPANVILDGRYFRALDEDGEPGNAGAGREAVGGAGADEPARRRPRGQLFRRSASEFCWQRRQGDGRREAGLSGGQPRCWRGCGPRRRHRPGWRHGSTTNCAPGCTQSSG